MSRSTRGACFVFLVLTLTPGVPSTRAADAVKETIQRTNKYFKYVSASSKLLNTVVRNNMRMLSPHR